MRNFVTGCLVLFALAGTAFSEPPKELAVDLGKGIKLEMVLIPAGEFMMGSPDSDKDATHYENRNIGFGSPSRSTWASISLRRSSGKW